MKIAPVSLLFSVLALSSGSAIAFPYKVAQINIPVPTVEEASPTPLPGSLPPSPVPPPVSPAPASPVPIPVPTPSPSDSNAGSTVSDDFYFLTRAKNLARQAAINENGGLLLYRPEASMYGPALQSPFTRNTDGSVTFTFQGGAPGATALDKETEVRVDSNAAVTVVYNGSVRGASTAQSSANSQALSFLQEDNFIARARNLARQAGIAANGGLRVYRPEPAMFGPTSGTPVVTNEDGSLTFTFKGGAPGASNFTQETAVTVTQAGEVNVDFNRPL